MKVKFNKNGFIEELIINGENIINPWGIETSDSAGFFSLREKGCREKIINKKIKVSKNQLIGEIEAKLPFSHWNLYIEEKHNKNKILRKNKLVCLDNCQFNDFVSRFRFKKKFIKSVEINNKKLIHKDSRIYYQYPVNKVILNLISGKKILIKIISHKTIKGLESVMYVRDIGDEWIIHARLFPYKPKIKQIKILRKWYNKAIPQKVSDFLLSFKFIKNFLWYRAEKKGYFPISAYGLVLGKKGDILSLETEVSYIP